MTLAAASEKQRLVLHAVIKYGSTKEAADKLGLNENTVRSRLHGLYRRLGVDGIAQAAYMLGQEQRQK